MLIFDIDLTLIQCIIDGEKIQINIRPHIKKLFNYLNHYNIDYAFWSLGNCHYIKCVMNYLSKIIILKPFFILTKQDNLYIDLKSHIQIPIIKINNIEIKKIDSLFPFYNYLTLENTILIDDNIHHILCNASKNVYHIQSWCKEDIYDRELEILLRRIRFI